VKISDFLIAAKENNLCSSVDSDFLSEIDKKSTKNLLFYHEECKMSQALLKKVPETKKIILLDYKLDWVKALKSAFGVRQIPSICISKNGAYTEVVFSGFTECSRFLQQLS